MRIVFIGPPGVGKGTQSTRLAKYLAVPHLSTGDALRQAVAAKTALGLLAHEHMSQGRLVPDSLMLDLVGQQLNQDHYRSGYLLDGFPRTLAQAQALDESLAGRGTPLNAVLELKADNEELVKRLIGRGRSDDSPEVVRNRLETYQRQTAPLAEYYRRQGLLHAIDGVGTPDEVFARVQAVVDKIAPKHGR